MFREFREFALRGNVVDMAVGIIVGAAFGKLVDSLVADILMPPLGALLGNVDFKDLYFVLKEGSARILPGMSLAAAKQTGAITLNYGLFLNHAISFLIVAFAVFLLVRTINRLKRAAEPPAAPTRECPFCAMVIPARAVRCPHCTAELGAPRTGA